MTEQEAIEILVTLKGTGAISGEEIEAIDIIDDAMLELEQYRAIGTQYECRAAVEKQKEMIAYCDENDCAGCPYHNGQLKENRCMNDFIADEIVKGGGVNE